MARIKDQGVLGFARPLREPESNLPVCVHIRYREKSTCQASVTYLVYRPMNNFGQGLPESTHRLAGYSNTRTRCRMLRLIFDVAGQCMFKFDEI